MTRTDRTPEEERAHQKEVALIVARTRLKRKLLERKKVISVGFPEAERQAWHDLMEKL